MVERQAVLLALLPASLGLSSLAAAITASIPSTRSWGVAATQAGLVLLSVVLVVLALRRPHVRLSRLVHAVRLSMVVLALLMGAQAAVFAEALARTQGLAWWRGVAALGILGIALALLHALTYNRPDPGTATPG